MNDRRNFIGGMIAGMTGIVATFCAKKTQAMNFPSRPEYSVSNNRVIKLLQRCGDRDWKVAGPAGKELEEKLQASVTGEVMRQTGVRLIRGRTGVNYRLNVDLGTSADMLMREARRGQYSDVCLMMDGMIENIVHKIKASRCDKSFISNIQLCFDPSLYKQRRIGFYMWAELENARKDSPYIHHYFEED